MSQDDTLARFTVSLPEALLEELDRRIIDKGYASRSELVRDLIREKLVEERWALGNEEVVGVLTISYDHHQRGLTEKITDAQHHSFVNVLCSTHVHLDHHHCLETIIVRGKPADIECISHGIGGLKGVRFAKLTRASTVDL
ncbi:MAG: nickel-responsive transcriptional regulator NikR [Chromatiales bacterium]|nr:nickel-responsive transcriptional regulator NikR [Chromatiales bacterium]